MSTALTTDGRKALMDNLDRGQIVTVDAIDDDGEPVSIEGAVAKANRGIVVVAVPGNDRVYAFNASGHLYWKSGVGSTRMKHTLGRHAIARPTGEETDVEYIDTMYGGGYYRAAAY